MKTAQKYLPTLQDLNSKQVDVFLSLHINLMTISFMNL